MSELGKIINEAIDKAQEFAGELKDANDKIIDAIREQAPPSSSARVKTEELANAAHDNFPGDG